MNVVDASIDITSDGAWNDIPNRPPTIYYNVLYYHKGSLNTFLIVHVNRNMGNLGRDEGR